MRKKASINLILIIFIALILLCSYKTPISVNAEEKNDRNFTNLVVFAKFNGETEFIDDLCAKTTSVKEVVENSYSRAEYNVADYYEKVSNGKVKMQNVYLFDGDGKSVTLSNARGYYCSQDTSNSIGYSPSEYYSRTYELKTDWANAISSAVVDGGILTDFSGEKRYSLADLDKNDDGYIDSLTIVYKYSDLYSVSWSDCLWNYQDYYNVTLSDGKTSVQSGAYLQFTANFNYLYSDANGLKFASLKTMIHETGHIFGLKDLYRSATDSRVYYMSAMANALSPVPQYISAKEREALGWLEKGNIRSITSSGEYTISLTEDEKTSNVVCYKINLANSTKTVYLEYRRFDSVKNKYDNQVKSVFNAEGNQIKPLTIKSGLVCFLADKNTKFPNNLNTSGSYWNYEVLGGSFATKSDSALAENDSLMLSATLEVQVVSVGENSLTFRIVGSGIDSSHTHDATKTEYSAPTCLKSGNIEYYYCNECNSYFSDKDLKNEITLADTVIKPISHNPVTVKGYEPTCKKKGLTDGEKCFRCDTVLVEQSEINVLPHTPSEWIIDKVASASENGKKHKECIKCKEILQTEVIEYENSNTEESVSRPTSGENSSNNGESVLPPSGTDNGSPPSVDSAVGKSSGCSNGLSSNDTALLSALFLCLVAVIKVRRRLKVVR